MLTPQVGAVQTQRLGSLAPVVEQRGSAAARGYDYAWRKLRLQVLADEPLCRFCAAAGRVTAAVDVDHVRSIAEAPGLRLERSNLRPLCKPCHGEHTARGTWRERQA